MIQLCCRTSMFFFKLVASYKQAFETSCANHVRCTLVRFWHGNKVLTYLLKHFDSTGLQAQPSQRMNITTNVTWLQRVLGSVETVCFITCTVPGEPRSLRSFPEEDWRVSVQMHGEFLIVVWGNLANSTEIIHFVHHDSDKYSWNELFSKITSFARFQANVNFIVKQTNSQSIERCDKRLPITKAEIILCM